MLAGLTQLTSLNISSRGRGFALCLGEEELGHIATLTSLRHLSLAGHPLATVLGEEDRIWRYSSDLLHMLSQLTSCAILDISPHDYRSVASNDPSWLKSWEGLVSLQHLPLRELHIGITGPWPQLGRPALAKDPAFYKAAREAVEGAPARLGLALLRGARDWPSSEEASVLLRNS